MMYMKKKLTLFFWICSASVAFGNEISLDQFLQKVKEQNLNLKLEAARLDASDAKAVGIRLPPPMLGVTLGKEDPGNSPTGLEISQSIPFPSKIKANHSARTYEAQAQKEMLSANQNEILSKAKLAYIDLWLMQERIEVIKQKRRILEEHIKLSRSAVRSDSFLKIHLLKAESDYDLLENELESSKQKLKEKQLSLLEISNDDLDINPVAIEPPISSIPKLNSQNAIPQLEALRFTLEGFKERESEAKASWLPDFNLRYKQMGATSSSSKYSEVMIGITLPFAYFWQPDAEAKTAKIDKIQAELNLGREIKNIDTRLATTYSKVESLQKQLLNLKNKLIPRAEQRMKVVHNLAPRDMETIQDHRETMEAFPDLKATEIELRMQYEESIAELEKYITNKGQSHE